MLKHIILILILTNFIHSAMITKKTFVPILIGDITTFIPYTIVSQDTDNDGIADTIDRPKAYSQTLNFNTNSSNNSITLTGSDNDNPITFTLITQASHGTLSGTVPHLVYTPNHNYTGTDTFTFSVNDGSHNSTVVSITITINSVRVYGQGGLHPIAHRDTNDTYKTSIYYPSDIPDGTKVPVVFFDPGYNSIDASAYASLLNFIASHGYYVIYTKYSFDAIYHGHILESDSNLLSKLDTTNIGVIGHSLGGGNTFSILDFFSKKGYGSNGRFIMTLEAWYAFGIDKIKMKNLPSNTNVLMQQYGIGGNNSANDTDPRIPLTLYYLLDSIDNHKKDWQIVEDADHSYPAGNQAYNSMQGLLKPLDALMEYTFKGTSSAHDIALEVGNDDPYAKGNGIQIVNPINEYAYQCSQNTSFDIRYCDMRQFLAIDNNNSIPKPDYNTSYSEPSFASTVTRITERSVQSYNMHPYPKQGSAWNDDMRILHLGYRLYNASSFEELAITKGLNGNQAYAKMGSPWHGPADLRWSKKDAKKMYVLDSSQRFKTLRVNADNSNISTENILLDMSSKGYEDITTGANEGNLDYNDTHILFTAKKANDTRVYALLYKIGDNTLLWEKPMTRGEWGIGFDWMSVDAKAQHILVSTNNKIYLYDMNLENERLLENFAEHGDAGIDSEGNSVYVQLKSGGGGVWMYHLDKIVAPIKMLRSNHGGGHISCRNYKHLGWCYVNTAENKYKEVFALKLDNGSGIVDRMAQTQMSAQNAGCTQVNVSPDGKKVLFSSDWSQGSAEDYQADLESFKSCTAEDRLIKLDSYQVEFK
ncbi:Fibronectin type III domain protein [hydrothermal vent metagenome]|uniref:Fibronectin type III domain protein n=1 Tax=hydrothermal vent metagenome TaxID=652676 RepID=A0A1W1CUJ2_9ZZZZ